MKDKISNNIYAALDLGTNNCRLLIAKPAKFGQFHVVDSFSRVVRLGEGLASTGKISLDAMNRAIEALHICSEKMKVSHVKKMRLIATEACRIAKNGSDFIGRVMRETGLELEIIDRKTEAKLAVSGCSSLIGQDARSVVLFDIGGGSSEIAVLNIENDRSQCLANHITHWISLPVGVVSLSERYGGHDISIQIFNRMVEEVEDFLSCFECPFPKFSLNSNNFYLIGTSGTLTILASLNLGLLRYDRRKVDGLWLLNSEISSVQKKLLSWEFERLVANPCIGAERADLVLAGCAILEAIRRRWPSKRMRVADRGLREGLLIDMMISDGINIRY
ncbi:Exopolyphosphatase [Liberibacter crescens BT-1]|uniref:Exopolyphosphatase n=1 Tax=Liberibacter crescens (strain BT-1) TaxID=1215343 RepID=L0EXF6_LIBCB|nr:Exopolyphosphatase [Liberibacter crescens BT-1]